ncbi:MAG: VRR-NUC domain-containing protein [Dorea sp.]|nr:VRR-NUC domain-containing protein [Dorea sp.]
MLEKELEAKFREGVKAAGGRAYKFVSPGNSGVPDRLVVLPKGHIGFVELKQRGKKPTKLQERQHNILRSLGCYTAVLDRPENIGKVLDEIREAGVGDAI